MNNSYNYKAKKIFNLKINKIIFSIFDNKN